MMTITATPRQNKETERQRKNMLKTERTEKEPDENKCAKQSEQNGFLSAIYQVHISKN